MTNTKDCQAKPTEQYTSVIRKSDTIQDNNIFIEDKDSQTKHSDQHNGKEGTVEVNNDLFRTGAKCVPNGPQDSLRTGIEYHTVGPLRIKPGRGFRTISMSCSDKMMKWCTLGLQGGLLANLVSGDGIFLSTVVVASPFFDDTAFHRALSFRGRGKHQQQQQQQLQLQLKTLLNEKNVEAQTEMCLEQHQQHRQQHQQEHLEECDTLKPRDVQVFHVRDRPFIDSKEIVQQRLNTKINGGKLTSSGVGKQTGRSIYWNYLLLENFVAS